MSALYRPHGEDWWKAMGKVRTSPMKGTYPYIRNTSSEFAQTLAEEGFDSLHMSRSDRTVLLLQDSPMIQFADLMLKDFIKDLHLVSSQALDFYFTDSINATIALQQKEHFDKLWEVRSALRRGEAGTRQGGLRGRAAAAKGEDYFFYCDVKEGVLPKCLTELEWRHISVTSEGITSVFKFGSTPIKFISDDRIAWILDGNTGDFRDSSFDTLYFVLPKHEYEHFIKTGKVCAPDRGNLSGHNFHFSGRHAVGMLITNFLYLRDFFVRFNKHINADLRLRAEMKARGYFGGSTENFNAMFRNFLEFLRTPMLIAVTSETRWHEELAGATSHFNRWHVDFSYAGEKEFDFALIGPGRHSVRAYHFRSDFRKKTRELFEKCLGDFVWNHSYFSVKISADREYEENFRVRQEVDGGSHFTSENRTHELSIEFTSGYHHSVIQHFKRRAAM
eukprot:TRINITY_DN35444_c0_g1_i1.p1 TRINITY_DN35444_c0_g1~~TRINITY_DN35444_c0_g1_i1.p1  ORF type:complete len:447 (-),score=98.58 TRINITY_DN35444_c0_g1_i1:614-1954(-)